MSARGRAGREAALLGIDLGTTRLKAGLITPDGRSLAMARAEIETLVDPEAGLSEQDPEAWWAGLVAAVRAVVAGTSADVAAIAVTGHGPSLAVVDAAGRPVRPAIIWQDSRSRREADELAAATGLRGWALGVAPAALWFERQAAASAAESHPQSAAPARWYLNSWEALALRLTGVAAATLVPGQRLPDPASLAAHGLRVDRLPPQVPAGSVVGRLTGEAAALLGLRPGIPVVAGLVDAFASFHGAGLLEPGDAIDVGGAAGGFGVYWDVPVSVPGGFTTPAPLPGRFSVGAAMAATGQALDWLAASVVGGSATVQQLLMEAEAVPPGADGLVFLPYLAGERSPLWDPTARGAFAGLTLRHGRAHLARAAMEAAALAIRHVAAPMLAAGVRVRVMRVCGGPARSTAWNQIKANVTGFPVEVPVIRETAVVGAAIVAAVGAGIHPDVPAAIRAMTRIDGRLEPDPALRATYDRLFEAYVALHPAIAPILRGLDQPPEAPLVMAAAR